MSTQELVTIILTTIAQNTPALLAIIAVGAGVKIVFDIIFKALYGVTRS